MAGNNIPPRMTITGTAHRVTPSVSKAREDRPAQPVANVVVLTDGGGFADVYLDPEHVAAGCTPKQGDRILWTCDVDLWTRTGSQSGTWYSTLFVRLIDAYDVGQHTAPSLAAV